MTMEMTQQPALVQEIIDSGPVSNEEVPSLVLACRETEYYRRQIEIAREQVTEGRSFLVINGRMDANSHMIGPGKLLKGIPGEDFTRLNLDPNGRVQMEFDRGRVSASKTSCDIVEVKRRYYDLNTTFYHPNIDRCTDILDPLTAIQIRGLIAIGRDYCSAFEVSNAYHAQDNFIHPKVVIIRHVNGAVIKFKFRTARRNYNGYPLLDSYGSLFSREGSVIKLFWAVNAWDENGNEVDPRELTVQSEWLARLSVELEDNHDLFRFIYSHSPFSGYECESISQG